jgi:hypothetical protein
MRRAVQITVGGQPGTRLSVRCRGCKTRFTHEVTTRAWDAWRVGGDRLALGLLEVHACDWTRKWAGRAPAANITSSAFRVEAILWAPKPGGALTNCGGACRSARGPNCDCKCRGENHGAGAARVLDLDDVDKLIAREAAR